MIPKPLEDAIHELTVAMMDEGKPDFAAIWGRIREAHEKAVAEEREACAVAVDDMADLQWKKCQEEDDIEESEVYEHCAGMLENARNAIRARGTR